MNGPHCILMSIVVELNSENLSEHLVGILKIFQFIEHSLIYDLNICCLWFLHVLDRLGSVVPLV